MKINDIVTESTTAGSIATVAAPMTTQSRNASIYGGKKVGNLLTGKKIGKKYANSVNEGKMKELAMDIQYMDNGNFKKKYGKSKEHFKATLGDPDAKKTVSENVYGKNMRSCCDSPAQKSQPHVKGCKSWSPSEKDRFDDAERHNAETIPGYKKRKYVDEAQLDEDDLILVPGQGHRLKSGFIPHNMDRTDHEVEMARSDLFQAAKNAKQIYEIIESVSEDEGLEGWVQEKIIKANDYLNAVREYLEHNQIQKTSIGEDANSIAKRITVKKHGGNDMNSYAVFVDGRPAVTGLGKREVAHYKNMIMKKLQDKPNMTGVGI